MTTPGKSDMESRYFPEPRESFLSALQFWALLATCAYIGIIHQMYARDSQRELEGYSE